MQKKIQVAVILMNRDLPDQTDRVYEEVIKQAPNLDKKVYVIEAGSSKKGQSQYKTHYFDDTPYRGRYFAWNHGLEIAKQENDWDYYWFLANDIHFSEKEDCLQELIDVMESEPKLALVAPAEPEVDDYQGCHPSDKRRWHKASTVHGLAHLIRGKAIKEVGYANSAFHYSQGAGTEMTYKFWKAGWQVGYSDRVQVFHQGASTYGNVVDISRHEYLRRARDFASEYFINKYGTKWDEKFASALPDDVEVNMFPIQRKVWEKKLAPEKKTPLWRILGSKVKKSITNKAILIPSLILLGLLATLLYPRLNRIQKSYRYASQEIVSNQDTNGIHKAITSFLTRPKNLWQSSSTKNKHQALKGNNPWLLLPESLHIALSPPTFYTDTIPQIKHFNKELEKHNINLKIVLMPTKWEIHPEAIDATIKPTLETSPNFQRNEFITRLREEAINVTDTYPILAKHKSENPKDILFYHKDTHWTPKAAELVALHIAKSIPITNKVEISSSSIEVEIVGDLQTYQYPEQPIHELEKLTYPARKVSLPTHSTEKSEVILIGDSFSLDDLQTRLGGTKVPCGFPLQLSAELGTVVKSFTIAGGSATAARKEFSREAHQNPQLLKNCHTVVWAISPLTFQYGPVKFKKVTLPDPLELSQETLTSNSALPKVFEVTLQNLPEIIPDPSSVYPDAVATLSFLTSQKDIILGNIEVIKNHTTLPVVELLTVGEHFKVTATPWNLHTKKFANYRRIDETNNYQSSVYWIENITPLNP